MSIRNSNVFAWNQVAMGHMAFVFLTHFFLGIKESWFKLNIINFTQLKNIEKKPKNSNKKGKM